MRRFLAIQVLVFIAFTSYSGATDSIPCAAGWGRFGTLVASEHRFQLPVELDSAGTLYGSAQHSLALEFLVAQRNGDFVYVLSERGELVVALRHQGSPNQDAYMVGHPSLTQRLRMGRASAEVIAAGEILVRNGKVVAVSNESGTFRPPASSLEALREYFQNSEMPLWELKSRGSAWAHSPAPVRAYFEALSDHNPELQTIKAGFENLYAELAKRFPHPEWPGFLNTDQALEFLRKTLPGANSNPDWDRLIRPLIMLGEANKEGLGYALFRPEASTSVSVGSHRPVSSLSEDLNAGWELVRIFDGV